MSGRPGRLPAQAPHRSGLVPPFSFTAFLIGIVKIAKGGTHHGSHPMNAKGGTHQNVGVAPTNHQVRRCLRANHQISNGICPRPDVV